MRGFNPCKIIHLPSQLVHSSSGAPRPTNPHECCCHCRSWGIHYELGAVVGDDRVGYAEALDDVGEEIHSFLEADVHDGLCLDPLGKLVNRHEEVREVPVC
jgi:hypothetical protein